MKSIGGYFGLDENKGTDFYRNALSFNTARNALRFLIRQNHIKEIWLPDYDCSAVFDAVRKEKCKIHLYRVDCSLKPLLPAIESDSWLYIVNYYGQNLKFVKELSRKFSHLIVDNVQAFFTEHEKGTYTIYSCRKYFGVPDGAYLVTDSQNLKNAYDELPQDHSTNRMAAVLGRYEDGPEIHFHEYQLTENELNDLPVNKMSLLTDWFLREIDYKDVLEKRNENFGILKEYLGGFNMLKVVDNPGPYVYPLLVTDGMTLRKQLISNKVYVATLWPNVLEEENPESEANSLARNIVPLPCDQRYSVDDMKYIAEMVIESMEERK